MVAHGIEPGLLDLWSEFLATDPEYMWERMARRKECEGDKVVVSRVYV
jgi:hypothetical protein